MARIFIFFILGALGGFFGWGIVEPINGLTPGAPPGHEEPDPGLVAHLILGAIIGLSMGVCIGLAEARSGMSLRDAVKTVFASAVVGLVGGMFGFQFGSVIYGGFSSAANSGSMPTPIAFLLMLLGRSIGWAILGGFIGVALGIGTASLKKMVNGAVGGVIGGGIAGAAFEILSTLVRAGVLPFPGPILRFIAFTATGAAIGLFIGFIEELTKQAWIKLLKGKNEGKEFILFKPVTIIGRDELADIPVFGDSSVAPQHAVVEQSGHRYMLRDLGSTFGTNVNGNKVSEHLLKDGDLIEMGMMKLVFYEKATASRSRSYVDSEPYQAPQIPTSAHVCPYCGGTKDASGNCLCSVGGAAPSQPAAPSQSAPAQSAWFPENAVGDPFSQPAASSARVSPQAAKLTGVDGTYAGKSFMVKTGDTMIGRDAAKDVALSMDNTVSRNHARISGMPGNFTIIDEGSSNGTFVNGNRISSQVIHAGDVIQIGNTRFRFEE